MIYIITLFLSTVIIFTLLFLIWIKTKDVSFIVGMMLIYLFTFLGGWFIAIDLMTDNVLKNYGLNYYYLYDKMFPVNLDIYFLATIIFYFIFISTIEITLLVFIKRRKIVPRTNFKPFYITHSFLLISAVIFVSLSIFIMRNFILDAISSEVPAYILIRTGTERIPFYTVHQILIRMALFPLAIGMAVYFCGENAKYIIGNTNRKILLFYIAVFSLLIGYTALIGNRNELVSAGIIGALFYLANAKKIKKGFLLAGVMLSITLIGTIGVLRGSSPSEYLINLNPEVFISGFLSVLTTNEMFAAYMSMYGVLYYEVPLVYGYSFLSLFLSIVPRDLWPDRLPDIYLHYFNNIDAIPGQGYVIHHATGWYLNFSIIGIILGGLLLGYIWAKLFNIFIVLKITKHHFLNIFTILSPWLFVSALPPLMRGGIEAYKAVIVEHIMIPVFIIGISTHIVKLRKYF